MIKIIRLCLISSLIILMIASYGYCNSKTYKPLPIKHEGEIYHPLFGIKIKPNKNRYELIPEDVYKCRFKNRHGEIYLMGKTTKGDTTFYYIYGWIEYPYDKPKHDQFIHLAAEEGEGSIVVITKMGCIDIGAGVAWSPDKSDIDDREKIGLTNDVIKALLSDTLNRAIQTYGGKKEFIHLFDTIGLKHDSYLPVQIQDRIRQIRDEVSGK